MTDPTASTEPLLAMRSEFSRAGIWPAQPMNINPAGWISNFDEEDVEVALALLESFIFFNSAMTSTLLESAMASLAAETRFANDPDEWYSFLQRAIITFPTGEEPSPTDSGYLFVRMVRQELGFAEGQIFEAGGAVRYVDKAKQAIPIIFVDDIVGSGDQLIATWKRDYRLANGGYSSLCDQWENDEIESVHIVTPITTWFARERLAEDYPYIRIGSAHVIGPEYSARHEQTALVPEGLRTDLNRIILKYAPRLGLREDEAFGHNDLGLNLAFEHSFPDLSLPMLWDESANWKPLRRRS